MKKTFQLLKFLKPEDGDKLFIAPESHQFGLLVESPDEKKDKLVEI